MTSNLALNPGNKPPAQSPSLSGIEAALVCGDLSRLSEGDHIAYYGRVCESIGLNPLTKPFDYIKLNGKLTLYAKKDCADQLRSLKGVSITHATTRIEDGLAIVEVTAITKDGRSDCDIGCVPIAGLKGENLGNALMKAVTKAKRRVTLSICGLGLLDESEIESIQAMQVEKEVLLPAPAIEVKQLAAAPIPKTQSTVNSAASTAVAQKLQHLRWSDFQVQNCLTANFNKINLSELNDEELLDFLDYLTLFDQTSVEVRRLKWTPEQGKEILKFQFGLESRNNLNFGQLADFLEFLKAQKSA